MAALCYSECVTHTAHPIEVSVGDRVRSPAHIHCRTATLAVDSAPGWRIKLRRQLSVQPKLEVEAMALPRAGAICRSSTVLFLRELRSTGVKNAISTVSRFDSKRNITVSLGRNLYE